MRIRRSRIAYVAAALLGMGGVEAAASPLLDARDSSARTVSRGSSYLRVAPLPASPPLALPNGLDGSEFERLIQSGETAGPPPGSTLVYKNEINPVVQIYGPGANQRMADDLTLGAGACDAVYYNLGVYGSGPANTTFDVHTELWTGDPCVPGSAPIAGTTSNFNALPNHEAYLLEVTIPPATAIPATVWLAATFSRNDVGWFVAGQAEVGSTQNFFSENDTDANPDVCALFNFAGTDPPYAGFWADIYCETTVPPNGACCNGTTCTQTTQANCLSPGVWRGAFTTCQPNACLTGACCTGVDFEECADTNEPGCPVGLFKPGTTCTANACGLNFEAYKNSFQTGIFNVIDANTKFGDDLTLGAGAPCQLVAYEVLMAGGDTPPATFDARVELWTNNDRGTPAVDGDDLPLVVIPGTQRDFNGLAADFSLQRLLAGPFTALELPQKVWMVITTNANTAGPVFGGLADIGFSQDGFAIFNDPAGPNAWTGPLQFPPNGFDPTNCPGPGCVPAGSFRAILWCEGEAPPVAGACCLTDPIAPGGVECQDTTLSDCDARKGSFTLGESCAIVDCLTSACSSAAQIVGEGMFPFDNTNATTDGPPHAACLSVGSNQIEKDVWFCWMSPCMDRVFVRTCDQTSVDTKLAVYGGCACPPTDAGLLDCNDDACTLQSSVFFDALAGGKYLIRVGSFPGSPGGSGAFVITCGPPTHPACPSIGGCCDPHLTPGCVDEVCCETVCACDAYCCDVEWDEACATSGFQNNGCGADALCSCGQPCGHPLAGDCCVEHSGPGCVDAVCCELICEQDPFCCQIEWDSACAFRADILCSDLCHPVTGSCCWLDAGACFEGQSQSGCEQTGGAWTAGGDCEALAPPCVPETGACCQRDGECIDYFVAPDLCLSIGGRPAPSTLCADLSPPCEPIGACCFPDGRCLDDLPQDLCRGADGQWTAEAFCASLSPPCQAPRGACCFVDEGRCLDNLPQDVCQGAHGLWLNGVGCADLDPPCDLASIECDPVGLFGLQLQGGNRYRGNVIRVDAPTELIAFRMELALSGNADLHFAIHRRGPDDVFRRMVPEVVIPDAFGLGAAQLYASGFFSPPILLQPGVDYAVGVGWTTSIVFGRDAQSYPQAFSRGTVRGSLSLDGLFAPPNPLVPDEFGPLPTFTDGAYSMQLCMGPEIGACCDGETGLCLEDFLQAACVGGQQKWTGGAPCALLTPPCERHRGSCCRGTTGECIDEVYAEDCTGDQEDWLKGVACADRNPLCGEHTGACCDLLTGGCSNDVPGSMCAGVQQTWTKGATCRDIVCQAVTGACCDHDPFGGCTADVVVAACDCPSCEWFKLTACPEVECELQSIPTVNAWGLAVLSLLLLIGAKLAFRRSNPPDPAL